MTDPAELEQLALAERDKSEMLLWRELADLHRQHAALHERGAFLADCLADCARDRHRPFHL